MRSHLLEGEVRHRRVRPSVYELEHDVFYVALDLDEIDELAQSLRLVSRNARNIVAFRDADYLDPPAGDLRTGVLAHLRAAGINPTGWRITLVTTPRIFGYQFNPASFYLCRDASGDLEVVIVEVHNTFGERHLYTLRPHATRSAHIASMDKAFYVSPFISMDARYTVRVQDRPDTLRIVIDETEAGEHLLQASVVLRRRRLTDIALLRALVRHPFVPQKTTGLIHWHALRLWLRGVRFHRHGMYHQNEIVR
jgi:DUF1365 family protein